MLPSLFRNFLFAIVLLALVAGLTGLGIPATQNLEEYIVFVLTTEFDFSLLTSSLPSLEVVTGRFDSFPWHPSKAPVGGVLRENTE